MFPFTYDRLEKLSKKENDLISAEELKIWHYIKSILPRGLIIFTYLDIVDDKKVLYILKTNSRHYTKDYLNNIFNQIKIIIPLKFETVEYNKITYLKCSDAEAINRLLALIELKGIQ